MPKIYGKSYYIDIDSITERCRTGNLIKEEDGTESLEVNIFKYEIIKMCLERVLNDFEETEDELATLTGTNSSNMSFNIALNTLINNGILIELEDE